MRTIDIHAHLVPQSLWKAVDAKAEWYGFRQEAGDKLAAVAGGGKRNTFSSPKVRYSTEERLKDMDAQGVEILRRGQFVSSSTAARNVDVIRERC